jgi:menaquinone-9 beta-reductase
VSDFSDVVIVGGGIAGSSLAYALASAGRAVTVLESSVEYTDRVRGETMVPLGGEGGPGSARRTDPA